MQEKEIFQNYELKGWEFTPRIKKILGFSVIFNLLLVFSLAQANFLTAKSCDSTIGGSICSVLDAIYVGSTILDADTNFVNKDYVKTELEDADITFIDLSGQLPPLEYPEGYFALANPDQVEVIDVNNINNPTIGTNIPGITNNPTITNGNPTDIRTIPQVTPTPNKTTAIPNLPGGITNNPTTVRNNPRNRRNQTTTTTNTNENQTTTDQTTAQTNTQNQNVQSQPVNEIGEINKKPFEDLGDSLNDRIAKNELDLNQNFIVEMSGSIAADGKLDKKTSRFVRSEGNPQMIIAAKEAIEAVGDSGFLSYLKVQGIDKANLILMQNDNQIYIQLISDMKDVNKANTTASGFNTMLSGLITMDKNGIKKLDENSKLLVNNAKVTSDGKNFVLVVAIPKADAQAMINKSLKERAEKKNKNQPNSNVETNAKTTTETAKK